MTTLQTFNTLEQAMLQLQVFAKTKFLDGGVIYPDLCIRLARYDHSPIRNISKQIKNLIALTDLQQEFAIKLVTKYHKQWKKLGYDVSNINLDTPTELSVRTDVDRDKIVSVSGNLITLKFPFIPRLITLLSDFSQHSCGLVKWNKETKFWEAAATAGNMAWVDKFVNDHKFEKDSKYLNFTKLLENAYDYKSIQLDIVDDKLVLHDAPETMKKWIQDNIGEVNMSNFVHLVSSADWLVFTLSKKIFKYTIKNYPEISNFILQKKCFVNSDSITLVDFLKIIDQLQYRSIIIFAPDQEKFPIYIDAIREAMPEYNIISQRDTIPDSSLYYNADYKKNIYLSSRVTTVPANLIISFAGYMAGSSRIDWFNSVTKNIYYCQDMDNKLKKQLKKDESNINNKR